MAQVVGGGVLGHGSDDYERPDAPLGGVAFDGAVQCCCHGNDHLLQTLGELGATKVIRATLRDRFGVSPGGTEISG